MRCAGEPEDQVCTAEFTAAASGELYLFVNDAILSPLGLTTRFYDNNQGGALVQVERVREDAQAGPTWSRRHGAVRPRRQASPWRPPAVMPSLAP